MDFSNQRPACPIDPPAIARHVVFRLNMTENPRWITAPKQRQRQWKLLCIHLTDHVNRLRAAYGNRRKIKIVAPRRASTLEQPRFSGDRSCIIPVTKKSSRFGYRLRVRVDIHTELFSVTYLFDRIDCRSEGIVSRHVAALPAEVSAIGWVLDEVWTDGDMPAGVEIDSWLDETGERSGWKRRFGALITDFRGVILCPEDPWPMDGAGPVGQETKAESKKALGVMLATFGPLVEAVANPGGVDAAEVAGGEAVVCGMLGGKALYAAQLGQWGRGVKRIQPIRHLLIYAGHCPAQLGRLVRRMQVLGELRHAALLDWDADDEPRPPGRPGEIAGNSLRDVSRALRALGKDLNEQTRDITKPGTPMMPLQRFVYGMADISRMVDGGLTYRIEQSRYYASEFQRAIEHLRLVRVGDWQPYDDFVKRYILHLFARIHRIGNRYEALGRRVDRLLFYKQADLLQGYTGHVNRTLENIDAATGSLNMASHKQVGLLRVAESFAAVFLIYYAGAVFAHIFETEGPHGPVIDRTFVLVWAVLMLFFGSRLVLYLLHHWLVDRVASYERFVERIRRRRNERRRQREKLRLDRKAARAAGRAMQRRG